MIKDSPIKGYQNTSVAILGHGRTVGGFASLFYKKHLITLRYFTGIQNTLNCDDFSTDGLKMPSPVKYVTTVM